MTGPGWRRTVPTDDQVLAGFPRDGSQVEQLDWMIETMVTATRNRIARAPMPMDLLVAYVAGTNRAHYAVDELAWLLSAALIHLARGRPMGQP